MTFTRHSLDQRIVTAATLLFVCGFVTNAAAAPDVPASSADLIIDGQQAVEGFGNAVAFIGDVDGDGCDDFAVGAPGFDIGFEQYIAGRVDVYSGKTGELVWSVVGTPGFDGFGDILGWSLAPIGDLDGDGVGDVIIGAIGTIETDNHEHVYVHSGATGQRIATLLVGHAGSNKDFGWSVSSAGDVTGDGLDDILAGAPKAGVTLPNGALVSGGAVYLFDGASFALIHTFEGQASGDRMGESVAGGVDVNGDGVSDIAVGANSAGDFGEVSLYSGSTLALLHTIEGSADPFIQGVGDSIVMLKDSRSPGCAKVLVGAPYSFSGSNFFGGAPLFDVCDRSASPLHIFFAEEAGGGLGRSSHQAGDVDGDGVTDFLVADPGFGDPGRTYLFSGATFQLLMTFTGENFFDVFGYGVSGGGDANGDGTPDILVGARFNDSAGADSGRAYVFYTPSSICVADLNSDGVVNGADLASLLAQWQALGSSPADLTADNVVDGADLSQLLANWGPCNTQ